MVGIVHEKNKSGCSCLVKIRTLYPQLTKKEKQIANFILANDDVIYKTITELVQRSHTGYGSIIRFCQRLGFDGFQDFKIHLSQDLTRQKPAGGKDAGMDSLAALADEAVADIRNTLQLLSEKEVSSAARTLCKAPKILLAGCGGSYITAMEIEYRLTRFGIPAAAVCDNHMQRIRAAGLAKNDVAFLVSFSGSTKEIITVGEIARKKGATVIALTNFAQSPVASISDIKLLTAIRVDPLKAEVVSKVAIDFVIDALFGRIAGLAIKSANSLMKTYQAVSDRQL
jgi:DNA-binding MurR/RpiR family transcriptional regulator